MNFENLFETITYDLVLEGLGTIFGFWLMCSLFFQQDIQQLFTLFITALG